MTPKALEPKEIQHPEDYEIVRRAAVISGNLTMLAARLGLTLSAVSQWGRRSPIPRGWRKELERILDTPLGEPASPLTAPDPLTSSEGRGELVEATTQLVKLFHRTYSSDQWHAFKAILDSFEPPRR